MRLSAKVEVVAFVAGRLSSMNKLVCLMTYCRISPYAESFNLASSSAKAFSAPKTQMRFALILDNSRIRGYFRRA